MTRTSFSTEIREQIRATLDVSTLLREAETEAKKGRSAEVEGRRRLAGSLRREAQAQANSLINLLDCGREEPWTRLAWCVAREEHRPDEHQKEDVCRAARDRQEQDILLASKWLERAESKPENFKGGEASRWAQSMIDQNCMKERDELREKLKLAECAVVDNALLEEKHSRSQKRTKRLNNRVARLEVAAKYQKQATELAEAAKCSAEFKASRLEDSNRGLLSRCEDSSVAHGRQNEKILALQEELRVARSEFTGDQAYLVSRQRDDLMEANNLLQNQIAILISEQSGSPAYQALQSDRAILASEVQHLARENVRLVDHIDRISGRSR